ncbi:hypothetical protein [Erysipelothrix piscisicarius]|uniref:hypothetical protein n=1 Tax=Erysipelothrix piscisicarius TaxID=2485784 RepID=UPI002F92C284
MNSIKKYTPGFMLSCIVALIAVVLESLLPVKFVGASVIALLIGMLGEYMERTKCID